MNRFMYFTLGCLFGRYILVFLDYILEWFASYIALKISFLNKQINTMSLDQQQFDSISSIGFALPDSDDDEDYFEDKRYKK